MSKRHSLQPLPRRLSAEDTSATAIVGKPDQSLAVRGSGARPNKPISPSQHKKAVIEPRRLALKYSSQTLVLEYKESETGKLRHRSFRIDVDRFETAAQCERKLWARLSKAVVPGSLQVSQVGKLVAQLFQHEKLQNPDADELEQATEHFMAAQVERPLPTKVGLKPLPLADVKGNQLPEDTKPEKKVSSTGLSSDKENSPNIDVSADRGSPIPSTNPSAEGGSGNAESSSERGVDEGTLTAKEADKGLQPSPDPARSPGLLDDMPKLPGTLSGMPKLPGTLGGPVAGRRAGLQPLGQSKAGSGGFGSLTASLGLPDDDDDDDDYKAPALQVAQEKMAQSDSLLAAKAASPSSATPVSATSSNGSGAGRFLSVGVNSQGAGGDAKPRAPSDSFDLEEEVVEDEDIPDYADDFEDEFEDEDGNDLSLPLPGSDAKDKVGVEKKADADEGQKPDQKPATQEETAEAEEERPPLRGDDLDLNRVEETELEKYKTLMEQEFERNAIRPGDANWQHDVQVDFGEAEEDCGWDEEDEEVDDEEDAF